MSSSLRIRPTIHTQQKATRLSTLARKRSHGTMCCHADHRIMYACHCAGRASTPIAHKQTPHPSTEKKNNSSYCRREQRRHQDVFIRVTIASHATERDTVSQGEANRKDLVNTQENEHRTKKKTHTTQQRRLMSRLSTRSNRKIDSLQRHLTNNVTDCIFFL